MDAVTLAAAKAYARRTFAHPTGAEWAPGTVFVKGDLFTFDGGLFLVTAAHTASRRIDSDIANWQQMTPRGELDVSFVQDNKSGSSTVLGGNGLFVNSLALGRPLLVRLHLPQATIATSGKTLQVQLLEDGTNKVQTLPTSAAAGMVLTPINLRYRTKPSVVMHTYGMKFASGDTSTVTISGSTGSAKPFLQVVEL